MTFGNHPDTGVKCCPECHALVEDMKDMEQPNTGTEIVKCDCGWWDYL